MTRWWRYLQLQIHRRTCGGASAGGGRGTGSGWTAGSCLRRCCGDEKEGRNTCMCEIDTMGLMAELRYRLQQVRIRCIPKTRRKRSLAPHAKHCAGRASPRAASSHSQFKFWPAHLVLVLRFSALSLLLRCPILNITNTTSNPDFAPNSNSRRNSRKCLLTAPRSTAPSSRSSIASACCPGGRCWPSPLLLALGPAARFWCE